MRVPIVQAMLIAEHIYQDLSTKKHVICGVFDRLRLKKRTDLSGSNGNGENRDESDVEGIEVPLEDLRRGGSPMLFLSVTEVEGKIDLTLSYHSLRTGKQYFVLPLTLESDSPLKTLRGSVPLPILPAEEGEFSLDLLFNGVAIGSCRLSAAFGEKAEDDQHNSNKQ